MRWYTNVCFHPPRIREHHRIGSRRKGIEWHRDDLIQIQESVEALAGGHFRVQGDQGHTFLARISGRLRRFHIKVVPGDRVTIAVSPYDLTHGFIVYRSS